MPFFLFPKAATGLASRILSTPSLRYASANIISPFISIPSLRSFSAVSADTTTPASTTPAYTVSELPKSDTAPEIRRAVASVHNIKGHTKKFNPLARQISGLSANEALAQLAFSPSKRAAALSKAIRYAARQADLHHELPQDKLMIETAWTGKNQTSPRLRYHSRGRMGRSHYRTSMVSVQVREMNTKEEKTLQRFRLTAFGKKASLDPHSY